MKRQISKMLAAMAALLSGYTALAAFELTINDGILTGFTGDVPADLEIPETVVAIDDGVFSADAGDMSALVSVSIPMSVVYIGESAFAGCTNLEEVTFAEAIPGVLESGNVGFAATLEIGAFAFDGCTSLTSIIIPAHAASIGESAFEGCTALESVTFAAGENVTESWVDIGVAAFAGCEALETVMFGERLYDPDNGVFNAVNIGSSAFDGCEALTELYLGEGVVEIGDSAFSGIGIETLEIPASVSCIGDGAFADCENLADVYFAGYDVYGGQYEIDYDDDSVFAGTPYGNRFRLDIGGDGVVGYKGEIPEGEFIDLEIPDFVTWIGDSAFEGLEGLISVNIPTNVTYIGESAFAGCTNLEEVVFEAKDAEQVEYSWTDGDDVVHNGTYFGFNETLEIGMNAFAGCTALAFVDIPAHVSAVYEFAFAGCTALEGVAFMSNWDEEQSYLTVCDYAFEGCEALQSVWFEDYQWDPDNDVVNETYINTGVFEGCEALTELYLGEGVVEIGDSAFSGIGIETLEIPASVNYIGDRAFADCENLADVYFAVPDVFGDEYYVEMDEDSVFAGTPYGNRFRLDIGGDGVVGYKGEIPEGEFIDLEIPDFVTWIGDSAFEGLEGLISVNIPTNVTYIGESAFAGCTNLEEIEFEGKEATDVEWEQVTSYADGTTSSKMVVDCMFEDSLSIGPSAFSGCEALTYLELPAHVSYVGEYAFEGCSSLEEVRFLSDASVTLSDLEVGEGAFSGCTVLASVCFDERVSDPDNDNYVTIQKEAFSGCEMLADLCLCDGIMEIGDSAFYGIGIESLEIPRNCQLIGVSAFGDCESLTEVLFADRQYYPDYGYYLNYDIEICDGAFAGCSALNDVYFGRADYDMDEDSVFAGTPYGNRFRLDIDGDGVVGYKGEIPEGEFIDLEIPDFVTWIGDSAFSGCSSLASVTIPASVTYIDSWAFDDCSALKSFSVASGNPSYKSVSGLLLTKDGKTLVHGVNGAVTIPVGVESIGDSAFYGLTNLTSVTIPSSVTNIDDYAFSGCSSLASVTIPNSVTSIGNYAFFGCSSLASVTLPARLKDNLDASVFDGCPEGLVITYRSDISSIWTLKYHSNNGKNDLDTQNFNVGEAKRLYYMNSRLGWEYKDEDGFNYVFLGWAKSPTGAVAYENGALVKDLAAVGKVMHIYAVWQKRAYEVCFHSNDEDGLVEYQEFRPNIAKNLYWLDSGLGWTRPGYDFLGWAKAPTSTAVVYANGETVNNLVEQGQTLHLYAVWTADQSTYTVRFNKNDGSGATANQTFKVGETKNLLWKDSELKWTRSGYTFKGWSESASGAVKYANGEKVKNIAAGGATKNLYAVWQSNQPVYTVRFHKNDGSGATVDQVFKVGESKSLLWKDSQLKWSRDGYTFVGWVPWDPSKQACLCKYVNGETVKDLGATGAVVHLYAGWKSSGDYLVCFNKNDGTGAKMNQIIQRDKDVALAWKDSQLGWTRSGYTFKGWAESVSGAVKYANGATVKNLAAAGATKQLYAVWAGAANSFAAYVAFRTAVSSSLATVSSASTASEAVVPEWAVGTFYGGDDDSFAMITVSADGEVSGIILSWNGTWTIEGVADGLCIDAEVVDGAGNVEPTILLISQTDDGHSLIESEDGSIRVMN